MRFFKTMLFTGVLTAFLIASGFNMAYAKGGNDGNQNRCHDVNGLIVDCSETNNFDNSITNRANANADAKAKAAAFSMGWYDTDIKNTNVNKVDNRDTNVNLNGQLQGQTAHNEGVAQEVTVEGDVYKTPKTYMHIQPVAGPDTDTQTVKSNGTAILTKGSIMDKFAGLSLKALNMLAKDADDVILQVAVVHEPDSQVNFIRIGKSLPDDFAGYIYATCDDDECSAAGMEGKAMKKAAYLGFTHIDKLDQDSMEKLYASEWSVKLGGGASVAADGGRMMIAPGGGIGGGAAESSVLELPAMVFEVYYNPLVIK